MEWGINGKMSKKLLNKTVNIYLIFSILVMLISAPIFYYFSEKLYLDDADEALLLAKKEFIQYSIPQLKISEIPIWNKTNRDSKIQKRVAKITKDTIFHRTYFDKINQENEPYRVLMGNIQIENKPFTYYSRINLVESEDLIMSIVWLFTILTFLLLVGLFLISRRLSFNLWKPFYDTLDKMEQFEIDKNAKLHLLKTDIEEFNRLNLVFHKLIDKNTFIYKSQREFIENAAHELQTPLAIFRAKLDTIIQRSDITKGQFELLEELNEAAERLNKLNKNLLLLSKLESHQFTAIEIVSVNEIIQKQAPFFTEQAEARNISITIETKEEIVIKANPILIEIVVSNLFLNAIKHNIPNGTIKIVSNKKSLSFSNSGENKTLDDSKLFQRFSKTNATLFGNGLGLSIIKKIVEQNHWKINYQFQNNLHFFEIEF
jgi:two-component system sensor histidine kinase ArlS